MSHTALATVGQILWRLLEMHGVDARAIFRSHGLGSELLSDPSARVPSQKWDALALDMAMHLPDPGFALHAAHCWHPSNLGALGFAWLSSSTLRTGLERVARYWRLLGERSSVQLADVPSGLKLAFDSGRTDPVVASLTATFTMALLVALCRMNRGDGLRPVEVTFVQAEPPSSESYRAHFGCPVRFAAPEDAFILARADADGPLPTANRQIAGTLDWVMTQQLAQLHRKDVVARCKATLLDRLASGELSEEEMAGQLHMSRRTLQRKLAEAETTYQRLVDDTRRDLALRYIEDPQRSITDITFLLGFSQQSAFTRAFRRWTGVAPSQYRQRVRTRTAA
jgi:AraC-like DNA-binding protein